MTKKQRQQAIESFKAKLAGKGWKPDKHGNWMSEDKTQRVHWQPQVWKHQRKVNKEWLTIKSNPIAKIADAEAPDMPSAPKVEAPPQAQPVANPAPVKGAVTKQESERSSGPLNVKVQLDEASVKRIDAMAFKQVQTNSRMDVLEKTMAALAKAVNTLTGSVQEELHRIKSRPVVDAVPLFYHKMFNRISVRLRKRAIDVTIEDLHEGAKRKRVFRCGDWTRVEHLVSYRTLTDGIEELEVKPYKPAKKVAKKVAKKTPRKEKTLEDVRYEMERDGIPNTVISSGKSRTAYFDTLSDAEQRAMNRSREKAEKVIVKLCSPGGKAEGAKDEELIEALHANGFDKQVAFFAAMNCGRITDPAVIRKHQPKRKAKAGETSNEY